ncbi:MAG: hypothetical protein JKY22_09000, partial [Flavobacteriaceae bacterium]|nr:hypothetical protein [Flavobacteriaceae bacterium]
EGSWIVQIKASNKAKGEALLVANDYRRFNYTPYAYRTKDYGKTWQRIVDSNDVISYALCIIEDPIEKNLLFLGTDDGLYVSIDAGSNWQKWTHGFPTTSVKDLVIHTREHDLVIGSFGRAAWILDDIRPLRAIAKNPSVLNSDIKLFESPTAYQAAYQQPTGSRFGGDALYNGENRGYGARMKYYFKKVEKEDKDDVDEDNSEEKEEDDSEENSETKNELSKDSVYMKIYDGSRLIRTLKRKIPDSTGIYNWTWFMNEAGGDRPSRTIRKRKGEPGGVSVKPGTYRTELLYMEQSSSSTIKVENDPRLIITQKSITESYTTAKELEKLTQTAADAVKQLVESKNIAPDYKKKMKKEDDKKYKIQVKETGALVKKIDSIVALYIGKEDKRQGITSDPNVTVMQRIYTARGYVNSRPNGMTNTENQLMKQAKDALNSTLQKTNAFFNKDWVEYKAKMEKVELSIFKETKTFQLD